jgi:hypothetical protein
MPYCQPQAVLQRVADALHVAVADLPAQWQSLAAQSTKDAAADLVTILALKGYSGAVAVSADQFAVWQERLAAYFCLGRGSALASFDLKAVEWLDPRKMLTEAGVILVDGVPTAPAVGESDIGGVGFGRVTATTDAGCRFDRM